EPLNRGGQAERARTSEVQVGRVQPMKVRGNIRPRAQPLRQVGHDLLGADVEPRPRAPGGVTDLAQLLFERIAHARLARAVGAHGGQLLDQEVRHRGFSLATAEHTVSALRWAAWTKTSFPDTFAALFRMPSKRARRPTCATARTAGS